MKEAFPDVRAVATAGTVEACRWQGSQEFVDSFWGARFPGQIPMPEVAPDALDGDGFELEGHRLQVIGAGFTDTLDTTALWVPDLRPLVAGDVAYNGIHLYTPETTTTTRDALGRGGDSSGSQRTHRREGHLDDRAAVEPVVEGALSPE